MHGPTITPRLQQRHSQLQVAFTPSKRTLLLVNHEKALDSASTIESGCEITRARFVTVVFPVLKYDLALCPFDRFLNSSEVTTNIDVTPES
jgi:hypothetical protein